MKKHKKHKKSNKSERSHKKHKKSSSSSKKRHRHTSGSESSSESDAAMEKKKTGALNEKFTEIMLKAKREASNSALRIEHDVKTNKLLITKPFSQTDPTSLVDEITKTIQTKVLPTMEVVSSGSESEV